MHPWCIPLPGIRSLPVPGRLLKNSQEDTECQSYDYVGVERQKDVQYPKRSNSCTAKWIKRSDLQLPRNVTDEGYLDS